MESHAHGTSQAICLDNDPRTLAKCPGRKVLADGNLPPFKPEAFQLLLCTDTIHLIDEPIDRLVKPGGHCVVSIFFNKQNIKEQEAMVLEKTMGLDVLERSVMVGKESKLIFLLKKPAK